MSHSSRIKRCPCPDHEGPNPLPFDAFGRNRGTRDGLASWCRECARRSSARYWAANQEQQRERARRWKQANPEKQREANRAYRAANRDQVREADRERSRRYRAANPEKVRDAGRTEARRRRRRNPEKVREAARRYRAANPEKVREARRRRYQALRDSVLGHYGRSCACCGSDRYLSVDHIGGGGRAHRIALFGRSDESHRMYRWLIAQGFPDGYQTLCRPCNSSKADGPVCRLSHLAS